MIKHSAVIYTGSSLADISLHIVNNLQRGIVRWLSTGKEPVLLEKVILKRVSSELLEDRHLFRTLLEDRGWLFTQT